MASNNPQDYINPIIQSMAHVYQLRQQKENAAERAKEFQQEQKLKEQQFGEAQKRADQQHEMNLQQLEMNKRLAELQLEHNKMQTLGFIRDAIANGADKKLFNTNTPQVQGPNGINVPSMSLPGSMNLGGTTIPYSAFPGPEQIAQQEAQRAAGITSAQTSARAAAEEPFKIAADERDYKRQFDVMHLNRQMQKEAREEQIASAERINKLNIASHEKIAAAANATHLAVARLNNAPDTQGVDPAYLQNVMNDVYITGNTPITTIPAKLRPIVVANAPKDWTPRDKKDDTIINEVGRIDDILEKARDLAEYSRDSHIGGTIAGAFGLGDAGRLKNYLTGTGGGIAETFGKEIGRKSEGDIKRAVELLYSPKLSKAENLKNIEEAKKIFQDVLKPVLGKYGSDQAAVILSRKGIDPNKYLGSNSQDSNQRIRVRSKTGVIGTIPSHQLQDAIKEGYTQVQ